MSITENIKIFKDILPQGVELVAVSKFHPVSYILEAYNAGQRLFGESRVQEFLEKQKELPTDIQWHFIGHLQTNKVKSIIGKTALIESVDSEKLINIIDSESQKTGVVTNVLMQVHVAAEETKFGFYPQELLDYFYMGKHKNLKATHIAGIMGMATNTDDTAKIASDFKSISDIFHKLRNDCNLQLIGFDKLSMGMSGDWEIALKYGANIIRVGSAIFGTRQ